MNPLQSESPFFFLSQPMPDAAALMTAFSRLVSIG
jgi:hypothetical protein